MPTSASASRLDGPAVPASASGPGGARAGAGRPRGSGKLGPTTTLRVSPADLPELKALRDQLARARSRPSEPSGESALALGAIAPSRDDSGFMPLYADAVPAGFPSPGEDAVEARVDLNALLCPHPESTFVVKVSGWSMKGAGIFDGDYLLVDRSLEAKSGRIVVAYIEGRGMLVKRLLMENGRCFLTSENPDFAPIEVSEEAGVTIWGVARAKAGHLI